MKLHGTRLACLATALVLPPAAAVAQAPKPSVDLTFGVYTSDKATTMYRMFTPVLEHLQELLEKELTQSVDIQLKIYKTYDDALQAFVRGEVDFVRFGPASYVLVKREKPGIHLLAAELNDGKRTFRGMIVVRQSSPIKTLADLKGRSFAFGDYNSTIGRYLVQDLLVQSGIRVDDLARHEYLGSHDQVFRAVEIGDFDAGSLKEGTFEKLNRKNSMRVLVSFENVTKPWIAREGLDTRVVAGLRAALLKASDKHAFENLKVTGFAKATDKDFAPTRAGMERAKAFDTRPASPPRK